MDRPASTRPQVPKWAIVGALWAWFALALFTHYGERSPYSYVGAVVDLDMYRIDGLVVNHDAPSIRPVTQFFYDATDLPFSRAHNLKLPLHSLLVAAVASFLRSYMLASYVVNLLALCLLAYVTVTLADSLAYSRATTLIASLTCAALPLYTHHIGQPMHYVVGIVMNFLVMIAAMAGVRDPVRLGLLTAILTLSYDPYVFIAALLTWIAWALRWSRIRDWGVYIASSLLPLIIWRGFLGVIGDEVLSLKVRDEYIDPVIAGWVGVLTNPLDQVLTPFLNGHVGLVMSVQMTLALVYWPVLGLCLLGLREIRARFNLPVLLAIFFLVEQLATAAYDWENNPRRAIPVLFAVCCTYFLAVRAKAHVRAWRFAFLGVMVISIFLSLSDSLLNNPVVGYILTGKAMGDPTRLVLDVGQSRLDESAYPRLRRDEPGRWWDMRPAGVRRPAVFVFANVFLAATVVALLHILRARALVPRYLPEAFGIGFLLSLVARFV